MTLGEKLYRRRMELGLSQSQVAGNQITRNMLSQLEHDQASPSVKTLSYLAKVLDVRISWLLEDDDQEQQISTVTKARELYQAKDYGDCLGVLDSLVEQSDESVLLYLRCATKYAEACLFDGKISEARTILQKTEKQSGVYVTAYDRFCVRKLLFACALADGEELEEVAETYKNTCDSMEKEQASPLLWAEYHLRKGAYQKADCVLREIADQDCADLLFLRGLLLLRTGMQDAAVSCMERAEQKGGLQKRWQKELFRILEKYYLSRENYQLAYRYAVLQME